MDLLTITCDRDQYLMPTQAKSIQKYVGACTHWVIVNESNRSKSDWLALLSPFYTNHTLKLLFSQDIEQLGNIDGYKTQQYWKVRAVDFIDGDYVILDSKNIFIRNTDLDSWTHEGTGVYSYAAEIYEESENIMDNVIASARDYYAKYYNLPRVEKFFTVLTPFVARKQVMNEVSELVKNNNVFADDGLEWHSEFMLYSMIASKHGVLDRPEGTHLPDDANSKTILFHDIDLWNNTAHSDGISRLKNNENYACVSLHRSWVANSDQEVRNDMVTFLESLGILEKDLKAVLEGNTHET